MSGEDLQSWFVDSVQRLHLTESNSVLQWLVDLRPSTETECMCVLQGKSLTADPSDVTVPLQKSFSDHINSVYQCSSILMADFTKLRRRLSKDQLRKLRTTSQRITRNVNILLEACSDGLNHVEITHFLQLQQQVQTQCGQLTDYIHGYIGMNGHKPDQQSLDKAMTSMEWLLNEIKSWTIDILIKNQFECIKNASDANAIVNVLGQLITAGIRQGEPLCRAVASNNGVRQLIELLYGDNAFNLSDASSRSSSDSRTTSQPRVRLAEVKAQILRTLATLCCVEESILQLHEAGGIDCLCDILCDGGRSPEDIPLSAERVKCEAAGVLAQITSPQFAHSSRTTQALYSSFIDNMADLINSLTGLCCETTSHEVFLLSCAALANMSLLDTMTFDFLILSSTPKVLVDASTRHVSHSLFVKDQIITVLACMASSEGCSQSLSTQPGVAELIVQYLHERPRPRTTPVELSACERLQQKSAIAISRLCNSEDVGLIFIELHCVPRLIELCNDPFQRNHSDSVLLSCLTALRKLRSVCGSSHESMQTDDVLRLVHFGLADSFLQHAKASESFI